MGIFSKVYDKETELYLYRENTLELVSFRVFSTVRDALNNAGKNIKLLGVTSTHRGEGVSTVVRIIGHALYNSSYMSALVVDAAAHNPFLHKTEHVSLAPGLAEILTGKVDDWRNVIVTKKENVYSFLPLGVVGQKSIADCFINPGVTSFLEELRKSFDITIFDLPPVGSYPEIISFLAQLDSVIFVIRAHQARFPAVKVTVEKLKSRKVDILGAILNGKKYFIPNFLYKAM